MNYFAPFESGCLYHIYNHGNAFDNIFIKSENYPFFLKKANFYLSPVLDFYAYNLLFNHFHLIVKIKNEKDIYDNSVKLCIELKKPFKILDITQQFSNFFNSYSKSFNKVYKRRGSLFQDRFKRIIIKDENKLKRMFGYIHTNAQHHHLVNIFLDWPHTSYHKIISSDQTIVKRDEVLEFFGGIEGFIEYHTDYSTDLNDKVLSGE